MFFHDLTISTEHGEQGHSPIDGREAPGCSAGCQGATQSSLRASGPHEEILYVSNNKAGKTLVVLNNL